MKVQFVVPVVVLIVHVSLPYSAMSVRPRMGYCRERRCSMSFGMQILQEAGECFIFTLREGPADFRR